MLHFEHFAVEDIVVGITIPVEGRLDFGVGVVVRTSESSATLLYLVSCRCNGGLKEGGVEGPDENEVESERSEPKSGVDNKTSGSWHRDPMEVIDLNEGVGISCLMGSGVDRSSEDKISESLLKELTEDFERKEVVDELDGSAKDKNRESGDKGEVEAADLKVGETDPRVATGIRDCGVLCDSFEGRDTGFGDDDGDERAEFINLLFISSIASSDD